LLAGGAALSSKFTQKKIAPSYCQAIFYAKDAMTGLLLTNESMDPAKRETVLREHADSGDGAAPTISTTVRVHEIEVRSTSVRADGNRCIPSISSGSQLETGCA